MSEKPTILRRETIATTRLFRVEQLDLRFSNGTQVQYERLKGSKHGAVLIVPMLDAGTVLLVKEYAAGVDRYELGLPKGRLEPEETPEQGANREMMEEIGYAAKTIKHITSFTLAPAYLGHTTHIVLAQDLYNKKQQGDEPEELEVIPWKLADLTQLLLREDFTEARSIAALYYVRDLLENGNEY